MFFLGASSHFLLYLLVPAFITVCLWFGKQPVQMDNANFFFPENVCRISIVPGIIHAEEIKEEKKERLPEQEPFVERVFQLFEYPDIPKAIFINSQSLRAPPLRFLFHFKISIQ